MLPATLDSMGTKIITLNVASQRAAEFYANTIFKTKTADARIYPHLRMAQITYKNTIVILKWRATSRKQHPFKP